MFEWFDCNKIEYAAFPVAPMGCNCCIIRCKETGEAIVLDPGGEAKKIGALVAQKECRVKVILHTHAHIDHCLATHEVKKLCLDRSWTDVKTALHPEDLFLYNGLEAQCRMFGLPFFGGNAPIDHELADNEVITFGNARLKTIHTPGHTPGCCSFLIEDELLLFSGDTLFAMGVGRTDLPGGDMELLFHSIKERLFTLDEAVRVIPGHGGFTTIGNEKHGNPFF